MQQRQATLHRSVLADVAPAAFHEVTVADVLRDPSIRPYSLATPQEVVPSIEGAMAQNEMLDQLSATLLATLAAHPRTVVVAPVSATHSPPVADNLLAILVRDLALNHAERLYGAGEALADLAPLAARLAYQGLTPLIILEPGDVMRGYAVLAQFCAARLPGVFVIIGRTENQPSGASLADMLNQTSAASPAAMLPLLRTLPKAAIGAPAAPADLRALLDSALDYTEGAVVLFYTAARGRVAFALPPDALPGTAEVGKAHLLRPGKEVILVGFGGMVGAALNASRVLARVGLEAAVVDARWLRPLDHDMLSTLARHIPRIITLEEGRLDGGFGSSVLEVFEESGVRIKRIGGESHPLSDDEIMWEVGRFLLRVHRSEGLQRLGRLQGFKLT